MSSTVCYHVHSQHRLRRHGAYLEAWKITIEIWYHSQTKRKYSTRQKERILHTQQNDKMKGFQTNHKQQKVYSEHKKALPELLSVLFIY